ncbi:MAG: acyl-CoA dehydrogenase family protein, partial [Oligoflexia bacterium]|nr:acyl-CoA dehydrogenase family protein [Oligoflexia bacterium]
LTEPDAGSDLQSITLKATEIGEKWYLNGVKRFITNGCAQVSLVMARSEEGSSDARGISLFIYERTTPEMKIRRIEHKLGIHGSPTCELQFNNAPAELLGKRRFGLIKYTMSLMNGARLGVSAQALGISEAAYRESIKYANKRMQFKKHIKDLPAISEMLNDMSVNIQAMRSLLYETARIVDLKEGLEEKIENHPEAKADLAHDLQKYTKLASLLTPLAKLATTEMGNKICYDAIQIHGGVGYTTEFAVERLYRDIRITNIYEGTSQMQVVAAMGGIISGVIFDKLNEYENKFDFTKNQLATLFEIAHSMKSSLELAVAHVKSNSNFQDQHSRRLADMSVDVLISYLLIIDAIKSESKKEVAKSFISKALHRVRSTFDFIISQINLFNSFNSLKV